MAVPYTFAGATSSIPLSQLDANFATAFTLGNTAIQLGNTVTTLNNMTLANVTISSGNVTITNVSVTTANVTTGNVTTLTSTNATLTNMSSGNVTITGGTINGTTLGATTAASANVTTLTTSSTVTLNGGTANGVAYLNGSKVLTTGSALTYNGTSFGVGSSSYGDAGTITTSIGVPGTTAGGLQLWASSAQEHYIQWGDSTSGSATYAGAISYSHASDFMRFWTNSSEQMRLTSTGLGIGTSSPAQKLDVRGGSIVVDTAAAGLNPTIFFDHDNFASGTRNYIQMNRVTEAMLFGVANADRMTLDSSGNLGIGTSSPSDILTLAGGASGSYGLTINNAKVGGGTKAIFQYDATNQIALVGGNTTNGLAFQTLTSGSLTTKATLDTSGNLGIGTSSPAYKLDVVGAVQSSAGYYINGNTSGGYVWVRDNYALRFGTNDTERARITSGGYFLVGTTSASGKFVSSTSANTEYSGWFESSAATGSLRGVQIKYSGQSPNSAGEIMFVCTDSTATRAYINSNGGFGNYQANDVNLSDRREKTNFAPAKDYLDTICAIPVQTFNYIDQSENDPGLTLGVVAQDVQAVAPELVMESNWGTEDNPKMRLSIYQTDLQYALMKCIQELKAQNDDLRARVAALEAA